MMSQGETRVEDWTPEIFANSSMFDREHFN